MLKKMKTITNIGSVVMSAFLVALQIVDLVKNRKSTPEIADGRVSEEN